MNNMYRIFVWLVLAVSISIPVFAQGSSVDEIIKQGKTLAYQAYNSYNKVLFLKARSVFESAVKQDAANPLPLYYVTYVDYKLCEMNLQSNNDSSFQKYYSEAEKNGEVLAKTPTIETEGKTLLAAIYMMKIANSPMSAVSLTPKIFELLNEAEQIDPSNPRLFIIRGSMRYNMPKMFGGSYEDAAKNFQKAISIFEKEEQADSLKPSWGYLEAMAWLGQAYEQLGNNDSAKFIYQKALSVEPEFGWIKYNLLPNLEKKMTK